MELLSMPKENENFDAPLVEVQFSWTISIISYFVELWIFPWWWLHCLCIKSINCRSLLFYPWLYLRFFVGFGNCRMVIFAVLKVFIIFVISVLWAFINQGKSVNNSKNFFTGVCEILNLSLHTRMNKKNDYFFFFEK